MEKVSVVRDIKAFMETNDFHIIIFFADSHEKNVIFMFNMLLYFAEIFTKAVKSC